MDSAESNGSGRLSNTSYMLGKIDGQLTAILAELKSLPERYGPKSVVDDHTKDIAAIQAEVTGLRREGDQRQGEVIQLRRLTAAVGVLFTSGLVLYAVQWAGQHLGVK